MPLTAKQVRHAKPGRHSDGRGLYLLVKPTGARSWVLRVQHDGRRQDFGLGSVAYEAIDAAIPLQRRRSLTLTEAREKARIGRELAKAGINPSIEWKEERVVIPSFEETAREYHEQISKGWRNGKHGQQWLCTLETYACPRDRKAARQRCGRSRYTAAADADLAHQGRNCPPGSAAGRCCSRLCQG